MEKSITRTCQQCGFPGEYMCGDRFLEDSPEHDAAMAACIYRCKIRFRHQLTESGPTGDRLRLRTTGDVTNFWWESRLTGRGIGYGPWQYVV